MSRLYKDVYSNPNFSVRKYVDYILMLKVKFDSHLAIKNRGYTGKTRLRGLFYKVHGGGLRKL